MKRLSCIILIMCLLVLQGCDKKSVSDIYELMSMENVSVTEEEGKKTHKEVNVKKEYQKIEYEIDFIDINESADYKDSLMSYEITISDVMIGDNIFDMNKFSDEKSVNRAYMHLMEDENNEIEADGSITESKYNTERCAIFIKIKVKNNYKEKSDYILGGLKLFNILEKDGKYFYDNMECKGPVVTNFVKNEGFDRTYNHVYLEPGEEKDAVLVYFLPKERIKEYTSCFEGKEIKYKDIVTDGTNLKNVHIVYVDNGDLFRWMKVHKLNIIDGEVVK